MIFLNFYFIDLTELSLLDLSFNRLGRVSAGAFASLSLDYLFLGDNPTIVLPPSGFTSLSTEVLDLKNCKLTDIPSTFISPLLPSLRKLFINDNKIKSFPPEMSHIFSQLESIRIQENPLVCDCQSRWLKQFYDDNTDKIRQTSDDSQMEPRCNEPLEVAGEFFNRLSITDFLCDRPSLDSQVTFTKDKSVLKCTSKAHPPPTVSWYRPDGSVEQTTFPTENEVTNAEIEISRSADVNIHGAYRCVASNDAGNTSLSVNLTWPPASPGVDTDLCGNLVSTTGKEIIIDNNNSENSNAELKETDVFKKKYFTIVHIIVAVFGTFAGTLVVTVIVLHLCVYRKRKTSSQYGTPPNSEYSGGSIKNEVYPPANTHAQHMQIHSMHQMQSMQNRPLPNEPCHKAYDENHYMSTQLAENEDLVCFGQHNQGALISPHTPPTCQCQPQPMGSHHRPQQIL